MQGIYPVPYGLDARLSLVDLRDVAAAAVRVLTEAGHVGATYELAGPQPLSQTEVADLLAAALGRPVRAERVAWDTWEADARQRGMSDDAMATLLAMFRYYDSLVEAPSTEEAPKPSEAKDTPPPPPADPAADMLKRAVRLLAETKGEAWVNKGSVWHMIKRLDPTFDPKDHGHANFADLVRAMEAVVEIKKGETDHMLRVR